MSRHTDSSGKIRGNLDVWMPEDGAGTARPTLKNASPTVGVRKLSTLEIKTDGPGPSADDHSMDFPKVKCLVVNQVLVFLWISTYIIWTSEES